MHKKRLPPDFDWVTERRACSALKVFELLALEAQKSLETFMAESGARAHEFARHSNAFSVSRRDFGDVKSVRFALIREDITITGYGHGLTGMNLVATLTLNNEGECRLKIGDQELDRWQVLRRALEPLLFASNDD